MNRDDIKAQVLVILTEAQRHPLPTGYATRLIMELIDEVTMPRDRLISLLFNLADPTPCNVNDDGRCETHGVEDLDTHEQCPHAEATALLARLQAKAR